MENNNYQNVINNAPFGYAYMKIVYDKKGKPVDFVFLEVNNGFEELTKFKASKVINKKLSDIFPDIKGHAFDRVHFHVKNVINGSEKELEKYFAALDRWYKFHVQSDKEGFFTTIFTDITNKHLVSEALTKFNQYSFENIDYKYIADIMLRISEAKYVAFNAFDNDGKNFYTAAISGVSKNIKMANGILGFNIQNKAWEFDPVKADKIKDQKTTYIKSLTEFSNKIPKAIIQTIEATFNIGDTFIVKSSKDNKIIGDFLLIYEKGKTLHNQTLIESYADSAGMLISRVNTEDQLTNSENKYRKITENISDIIWTSDMDLNITYVSPSIYNITGYTAEEYIKLPLEKRHPEIYINYFKTIVEKDLILEKDPKSDKNRSQLIKVEHYHANGSTIWLEMHVSYVRDKKGNPLGFQGVSRDITELKLAHDAVRRSEEQYKLIFENSPLGILHFDRNGVITECNDHFVNIVGSNKKALIGLEMTELPDNRIVDVVKSVMSGKPDSFEGMYKSVTADKTTPLRVLFSPVLNNSGDVEGGIGIIEDRTSYIQQETLAKQVAVAKESAKFKQNFLANMSHEIRTPMTGIMGMIEILEKTPLNDYQVEYLNILKHTGENLMEIINQVLDFSKIEAGKVTLNKKLSSLKTLIEKTDKFFNSICNKPVKFEYNIDASLPDYLIIDEFRINQVINNLISNSVKFTDNGKIKLEAKTITPEDPSQLEIFNADGTSVIIKIIVSDTGAGIPEDKLNILFNPFSQVDDKDTRKYEGSGLGLSICKQIAELHGGEIGVKSKLDKGSTFWFTFIAEKSDETIPEQVVKSKEYDEPVISKSLRILLAEDKKVSQKVIMLMLVKMGHKVMIAENGQEVLDMFEPDKYDLILMDIQMPKMDGITATKSLKEKYKSLPPIVGLSANAFEGDKEKYMGMGMDDYITKPLKSNDIDELVERWF